MNLNVEVEVIYRISHAKRPAKINSVDHLHSSDEIHFQYGNKSENLNKYFDANKILRPVGVFAMKFSENYIKISIE